MRKQEIKVTGNGNCDENEGYLFYTYGFISIFVSGHDSDGFGQ